jgi:hypothetical protein
MIWLNKEIAMNWSKKSRGPRPPSPRRRTARLRLEALEDRVTPATFLVTNLNDAGPGSLRDAISQVNVLPPPATRPLIEFAPELAHQTIPLTTVALSNSDGDSALEITEPVDIRGSGQTITRAVGAPGMRLMVVGSLADVVLENLTFTGGLLQGASSGVPLASGSTAQAGAIFSIGRLFVSGCTFTGNQAIGGVGGPGGFGGNGLGGAIVNSGPALALTNCTFTGNTATGGGGGFLGSPGASEGGAVYTNTGNTSITHCTIVGNTATLAGTGIDSSNGSVWVTSARVDLINSVLGGTTGGPNDLANDGGTVALDTTNIIQNGAHTFDGGMTDGISDDVTPDPLVLKVNPMVGPLADNGGFTQTMALLPGSPALGVAQLFGSVTVDQRGVPRNLAGTALGAYEVQHPLSPVGVPVDTDTLFGPHPNASNNEAFVRGLYNATLLRGGSRAEVDFSVNLLQTGAMTRPQLAGSFYNSPENRGNQVKFFYSYFLGRPAAPFEIAFSVQQLQAGLDEGTLMSEFILSPEYTGNNTNQQFVQTMYYAILGRGASAAEVNFSVNMLNSGQVTRPQVLAEFLASPEGTARVVQTDYGAYLKRQATPTEVAAAAAQLQTGATYGSVAFGLLGSAEFFSEAGANVP